MDFLNSKLTALVFGLLAFLALSERLSASNPVWGPSGTGTPTGGSGIWNATNLNWTVDGGETYQAWSDPYGIAANFGGTGGTVSVSGSLTTAGLIFNANGYTLSISGTNSLTFDDTSNLISVTNPGQSVTINGSLHCSGIGVSGQGSIILTGSNYFGTAGSAGSIGFNSGTLRLNAATGSINPVTGLFFSGRGTFVLDNVGANRAIAQVLSTPTGYKGDGTIQSLRTAAQNLSLTFFASSVPTGNAIQRAGTINYVVSGGVNGTQNKISFTNLNPGYMGDANFFNGSSFAWSDSNNFLRGINYGSDADTQSVVTASSVNTGVSHLQITNGVNAQTTAKFTTIKLAGASNLNIASGNKLTVNGIMKAGNGKSLIQGGTLASGFSVYDIEGLLVRTDQAGDVLTIDSAIVDGTSKPTGIIKSGLGTLVLTGNNTYTGGTLVNNGILSIGSVNSMSSPGVLGMNGKITLESGTLQYTGTSAVLDRGLTVSNRATLDITQAASTLTLTSWDGFGQTLVKTGLGTLAINGGSTSTVLEVNGGAAQLAGTGLNTTGGLTLNNGLVQLTGTGDNQIDDDAIIYIGSAGLLDLNGRNETVHGITGNGSIANSGGATTTSVLSIGNNTIYDSAVSRFSGSLNDGISGGKMEFYKGGHQTQYLNGASTYSGGTIIADGKLVAGNSQALGSGTVQVNGGSLLALSGVRLSNKILLNNEYDHQFKAGESLAHIVDASFVEDGFTTVTTTASILDGTASQDGLLQTSFSLYTRAGNDFYRKSAAYNLLGTGSDIFVLQISLSDISLGSYLSYLDSNQMWVKAVNGNTGGTSSRVFGAYDPTTDFHLGYYGVDIATQSVWAVVNHGTSFAVLQASSGSTVVISSTRTYPNGLTVNSGTFVIDSNGVVSTGSSNTIVSQTGTDNGTLVISGTLSNVSAIIGQGTDSIGMATVTGSGATWTSTSSLTVGSSGAGMLNVQNGGVALAGQVLAGDAAGSYGAIVVSGSGSYLESNGAEMVVGNNGSGSLNVTAGATAADYGATIGSGTGSSGSVTVSGSSSQWYNQNYLTVGQAGSGSLNIQGGGNVTTGQAVAANNAGSVGSITVGGAGSVLVNTSTDYAMLVGLDGSGTLTVQSGGLVTNHDAYLGVNAGSNGSAKVTGAGSLWSNSGDLFVGESGTGALLIEASGQVTDADASIGANAGSFGTAKVTGADSTWNTDNLLAVGDSGTGSLTIEAAGVVHDTFGVVGNSNTGVGSVTVNGAGSAWTNSSNLFVGYAGSGTLSILSGATVSDVDGVAGYSAGSHGSVLVQGAGSRWNNGARVGIGVTGSGTLGILAGGVVSGSTVILGSDAGSYGEATVDGTGSQLNALQTLMVGNSGTGVLTVRAGATAHSQYGVVAGFAGSQGIATITGGGSQWTIDQGFFVGDSGTGVANILAGGHVTSAGGIIAQQGFGVVNVDGGGSQWSSASDINVGVSGTGQLNLTNGAIVTAAGGTGAILLAQQAGSVGTLQIGQGQSAGILQASSVIGGQGLATLGFNFSGTTLSFGSQLSGALNVVEDGFGTTVLTGSNQQTGDIRVNSGTLRVGNAKALGSTTNTLTVNGGMLDLSGKSVTVGGLSGSSAGVIASGTSGALTLSVAQDSDTLYAGALRNGSGVLSLAKSGKGTLALTGSSNYSGPTTVTGGFLQLSANNNLGSSALTVNGGGLRFGTTFTDLRGFVSGSNGATLDSNGLNVSTSGVISGPGGLTKSGLGSLTLSGANTYTGGTILDQGTLIVANTKALGAVTNTLLINNAVLDLNGQTVATGALAGGGIITNNKASSTGVLNTTVNGTSGYDGVLADGLGLVGLTKSGTGTLILTGNSTHSGPTTISAGALQLGNGGTSGLLGTSNIVNNATLDISRSDALGFNNTISGSGKLVKNGSGVLILGGNNTYTGGTVLNSGLLQLGNAKALGAATSDLTLNGGTLNLNGNSVIVGLLSGTGGAIAGRGAGTNADETLTVNSNKSGTFAGSLNEFGPEFTQITGTLIIRSNSGTVSYGPGTYVVDPSDTGYVAPINSGSAVASSTFTPIGYSTGTSSLGILGTMSVREVSVSGTLGTGGSGSNTVTVGGGTGGTFALPGDQGLSLIKAGTGTLTLSGSSNYHGGTTLSGGGLNLANANAIGTGALTISGVTTLDNTSGAPLTLATNNAQNWNANFTFKGSGALDLGTGDVIMNASRTVTVTSNTLTIGGVISGTSATFGLTKSGAGTLVLAGDNIYGGATTISQGTLQLGNGGTTGSVTGSSIANSGILSVNRSDDLVMAKIISGAGKFVMDGSGALTLSGTNTYTGGTVVNNGKLILGNAKALGAVTGDLTVNQGILDLNGNSVTVGLLSGTGGEITNDVPAAVKLISNSAKNGVFAGNLMDGKGTVAFEKAGTGMLTLSGSSNYRGGTILSGGGLNLANANAIGSGTLTISGATTLDNTSGASLALATNNAQFWNSNFTYKGSGALDMGTGNVVMNASRTVTVTSNTLTIGGAISGTSTSFGLTKSGTGTLVLAGNNTYGGMTTISQGTLQLGNSGTGGSLGTGAVANSSVLVANRSDDFTLANAISGAGKLVQNGIGTITVSGSNTYTGGTIINSGSLVVGSAKALGAATGDLTVNAGILDLRKNNVTVGALSGSGGAITVGGGAYDVPSGTTTLTTNTSKNTVLASALRDEPMQGGVSGGGVVVVIGPQPVFNPQLLALVKAGSGTLTLAGNNNFNGGTFLLGGGLNLVDGYSMGGGIFTIGGVSTIDNISGSAFTSYGGGSQAWNADFTFKGSSSLAFDTGEIVLNGNRTVTVASNTLSYGGNFSGATPTSGLIKSGTGTLVLGGNNSYGGNTTVSAGTLQFSGSLGKGSILNSGVLVADVQNGLALNNTISGSGRLVKNNTGLLVLNGTNSFTGGTTLNDGMISLGNAKGLGAATCDLTVNGGTLDLNNFSVIVGRLSGTSGLITNLYGTGTSKLTTNSSLSGTYAGGIADGSGVVSFEKAGTGTLTLSGSNSYRGGTSLSGGGLNLANANAIGTGALTISGVTTLDNTSGSPLALATNNAQNWNANFTYKGTGALDFGTGAVVMNASRTVTVTSNTLTVCGVLSGTSASIGLTKSGTGTLVLANDNTYGGATTISQGTLQLGNGGTTGSVLGSSIVNNGALAVNRSDNLVLAKLISGAGKFVKDGSGSLTLSGTNTYSGGTVLNNGTLVLGNAKALGATTGDLTVNGGGLDLGAFNVTVGLLSGTGGTIYNSVDTTVAKLTSNSAKSGTFAGSLNDQAPDADVVIAFAMPVVGSKLAFEKAGTGILTLSGSSNYSGGTTLSGGTLGLANAYAIGTGTLTIGAGTTLDNTSGAALALATNNAQVWNGNFTFKGSSALDMGSGDVALGAATRTIKVTSSTLTIGGGISGNTATVGLTKTGTGTLVLAGGNNTYAGTTTISQGTLQLGNHTGSGGYISGAIVNNGRLVVDVPFTLPLSNKISGSGRVIQNGDGILILSGANTYTGGTEVNAGTLTAGSATAFGTGNMTLNGGTLASNWPGNHQINIKGNLLWDPNARISLSLATDWGADTVNVTGNLTRLGASGGQLTFNLDPADYTDGQKFTLMTVGNGFGTLNIADFTYTSTNADFEGTLSFSGKSLIFTVGTPVGLSTMDVHSLSAMSLDAQAVPEPSTWALLMVSALALLGYVRHRRARQA